MFVLGSVGLLLLRPWVLSTFEDFAVKQTWWDLSSNQIQLRAGKSIWVGVKPAAERKRRREFTTNTSYFGYLIIHIVLIKPYSKVVYFSKKVIFDFSKIFFNYCRICIYDTGLNENSRHPLLSFLVMGRALLILSRSWAVNINHRAKCKLDLSFYHRERHCP